ncbi:hypothetical protein GCM10011575_04920 [Microlunatus endophyticus]|uniref:Cobyrinic acid a,c-diamide synthase n=1 Tax=Microlunatus endophyticus TaxID=1716077 RepID=A0A917S2I5_9ACTN|nr:hypothetical protein [Microlunatus endophyticus]GGL49773.1 hypothetical protein GCM10011575_04920 [Microlunatus endophyticus]
MPRRVSLPGAAELFRATPATPTDPATAQDGTSEHHPSAAASPVSPTRRQSVRPVQASPESPDREPAAAVEPQTDGRQARGSGRVRHDEKITVYVSNDELLDLERARLMLRADHGMAVDRGRIVREALALAIGDLAARGVDSELVRRLSQP